MKSPVSGTQPQAPGQTPYGRRRTDRLPGVAPVSGDCDAILTPYAQDRRNVMARYLRAGIPESFATTPHNATQDYPENDPARKWLKDCYPALVGDTPDEDCPQCGGTGFVQADDSDVEHCDALDCSYWRSREQ